MTPDELREKITRDQGWTLCYCSTRTGALSRAEWLCADCNGWMEENRDRIAAQREWWHVNTVELGLDPGTVWGADAAEQEDLGVYLARRFLG